AWHALARFAFGRGDIVRRRRENSLPRLNLYWLRHAGEGAVETGMNIAVAGATPPADLAPASAPQCKRLAIAPRLRFGLKGNAPRVRHRIKLGFALEPGFQHGGEHAEFGVVHAGTPFCSRGAFLLAPEFC